MSQRYEQRPEERDHDGAQAEELQWPGKKTKVGAAMKNAPPDAASNESDPRRPDIARIRSAVGKLGSGKPLPDEAAGMGAQLGIDISSVKLHENNSGAADLGAQGFTHGEHIALAPGVDLNSDAGQHIIAHELVHVAQNQAAGGAAMEFAARLDIGPSDSPTEREAESGAAALTSGQSFRASGHANLPGISLFEGPTPAPTGKKAEEFPPNDPRNPDYDPSKDPSVTSQVPAPVKTDTPKPAPPAPPAKPAPKEPAKTGPATPPVAPPATIAPKNKGPTIGPAPKPTPKAASPTPNLDELVKVELEKRKDPAIATAYESVTAQVDVLKIQALQFTFQESGFFNSVVSSLLPYESIGQHAKQISATNPYDAGTWQARIDGLRGVIRILGDIAGWVATIADIVAAVAGLIALITAVTGVGAVIGGAVAAIAAEIGTIAGLVKILLDIIDALLGILQMYITIQKIKSLKKGSPERVKLAALLGKEVKDVSATLTGVVVQIGTIVVTAGVAAGVGAVMGKGGFWKNFAQEIGKEFRPILPKKALAKLGVTETSKEVIQGGIKEVRAARATAKAGPQEVGADQISDKAIADRAVTAKRIDTQRQLIKTKKPRRKRGKKEFRDVIIHSSNKPVLRRGDLKIPKSDGPIKREVRFFVDEGKLKRGIPTLNERAGVNIDISAVGVGQTANAGNNESKDSNRAEPGGVNKPTADAPGTGAAPGTSPFTKVQMWPSQIEKLKATRAELPAANTHLMSQYENAKGAAGKHQSGQLEKLYGGVRNTAGQMRLSALAEEKEAGQSATENKQGADTAKKGGDTQNKSKTEQAKMDASGQKLGGTKVEKPPPKEGGSWWERAKNWLYNQTIGRIGDAVNGMQNWMQKTIGGIVMSSSGLTKEECDMAGIENSMRSDEQKDKEAEAQNKQTAADANKIDPALAEIMKGATADEQHALQAMLDSQEMATALDAAMKQLDEAITAGTEYINEVSPIIRHELETKTGGKSIDAAYVAPAINGANAVKTAVAAETDADADAQISKDELALALTFWPELNIEPGNAQIDAAKAKFVAAHGKAVADAQAASDGAIGKLTALIGTTNYDAVSTIATQLDSAVEAFLATEEKLFGNYIGQLEAVLDAYIELIQSAVTQEEVALPADQEPVQRKADGGASNDNVDPGAVAARGTRGEGGPLPHGDKIQQSFGRHDVSGVQAHVGGDAAGASQELGAKAYAQGNKVAFGAAPDLHTAAHEAAHVVQQRQGVSLKAIDGGAGDPHEKHADAVADAVVAGKSAEPLLDGKSDAGDKADAKSEDKADAKPDASKADEKPAAAPKSAGANAPVQRKEGAPPQSPPAPPDGKEKKKDPAQQAADQAAAKPKKAGGTADVDADAKKDVKGTAKEGGPKEGGDKAAPGGDPKKDAGKGKADAGGGADAKAAGAKDTGVAPPAPKAPPAPAVKPVQPADVAQPVAVAPVQPLALAPPTANKKLDEDWIKTTGRDTAAHHAQISADLTALTNEIQTKQTELMTLADQEATKVTQDLQGKVAGFTTSIVTPGRARVEAAFGNMTKTLDQTEAKAKADISVAKVQGSQKIGLAHTATDAAIQKKFTDAKAGNDALIKKNAPAATAVIKKFAGTIKPFIDKAKLTANNAATAIANADPAYDPSQGDAGTGGMAGGLKSLRADVMKSAVIAHGKKLGADYENKLFAIGRDVDRKAAEIVQKALEPAKHELDAALDVCTASAKKNFETAKTTATTALDTQEKASLDAVAKAKTGGQQKWTTEKTAAVENADKAGKEFTDNATAAGTELTSRIKKRASEDAKNYNTLAAEIQATLKKGGPRKYEDIAPKIADAKNRLAAGHATNLDELRKLSTTGATELGVTLTKHQGVYQDAIKEQEGQAKVVEAAIVKDVSKGATDMSASLNGLGQGFNDTATKETAKIDGAVAQFTQNANAALADFDKKVSEQLNGIVVGLDQKLQEDLAPATVKQKAESQGEKDLKAKQKAISKDAGELRNAMDGWGTDENKIYGILRKYSWGEIEFLEASYDDHYDNRGKNGLKPLRYDFSDELDSSEIKIATAYLDHDRKTAIKLELADSVGFWNDDEKRIEEVLRGASEDEIKHLQTDPAAMKVVADVKSSLGGADLDVMNTLLDQTMTKEERDTKANAIRLFDAMEGWGTDEAKVKQLLEQAQTPAERARLRAAFNQYAATKNWPQGSGAEGDDALDLALKDDMGGGELVVAQTFAKIDRDEKDVKAAKLIEAADGGGTDEDAMLDALDDAEYAEQWKALKKEADAGNGEAVKKLKELEDSRKADIDKRLATMGEKGGVEALIEGETERSYLTYEELLSGTKKDGKAVTAQDKAFLRDIGSGSLERMIMMRKLQTGQAEPELQLAYACFGVAGTHEDLINKAISNGGEPMPIGSVKAIATKFESVWGTPLVNTWEIDNPQPNTPDDQMKFTDPGGLLSAELGGKDWLKTRVLLCGEPTTPGAIRYVTKLQAHYATSGLIGGALMDVGEAVGFTEAKSTMQHSEEKFDNKYAQLRAKFGTQFSTMDLAKMGEDGEQLQLLSEYLQQDIEAYNTALASIVDTVVTVLEIVGGIIVTVVTAGTASPVLAAIIGNLIVSAGTIAFKAAAYGAQYGAGDLAKDVVQAAVTAGFAGLGEVKALQSLTENAGKSATGALFKTVNDGVNKGGGRLIGTSIELGPKGIAAIEKVVGEGTKNLILSSGQEIANTLTDEKTYDMKLGEALWGENSIGARLLKNAPKAFAEGAVKQMIDDVANVSNKDNQGGHKTAMANMFANMMSDAGANVAGFFVYVDNYQDAGTFWDQLLKSTGNKAASGFFQGYGMHKQRAKKSGRDFINGELGVDGLRDMLSYLDAREVRELADFVQKYGGDKFHQLPDEFKKTVGAQPAAPTTTPVAKPTQPAQQNAPTEPDAVDPNSVKKADADVEARRLQQEAADKKLADEAEAKRVAADAEQKRLADEQARLAKEAETKRLADEAAKKAADAELARKAEEARLQKEAEAKRIAEEKRVADEKRIAEEKRVAEEKRLADEARKKQEAEDAKKAEEARLQKEAEERAAKERERQRLEAEAEQARLKKEAEEKRLAEEARLKREAEEKLAEEARLKKEAEAKRLADEQAVRNQAFQDKEDAEKAQKQQQMDAAFQQQRDAEAKKKDADFDKMLAQQDGLQGDVDQKKQAALRAQQDKVPTGDEVRTDQDQATKVTDQTTKADEQPAKPVLKPDGEEDATKTKLSPDVQPTATPTPDAPAPTAKLPAASEMVGKGNKIYQHFNDDANFDKFNDFGKANPAKPMPELAFSGVDSGALAAIIQTGLKSGRALGKASGANADNIWFKAGAPFYFDSVTMVIPSARLREIGGKDTVGLAGQKDVMTLHHDTKPDGIPIHEFAIVYSIGHGYVIPLHIPDGWTHPIGQLPPADMLPPGFEHLGQPATKKTPDAPTKKPDAKPDATTDQEQTGGDVGSHKGKDVYGTRTQDVDGVQKPVPYSTAELQTSLAPLTSRKQGKVTINGVTEQGASLHMNVSVDGGPPADVVIAVRVSDKLAPSSHGDDGGSARFVLDHVDGKWTATIDVAQGLDPRDVRFVLGHELDEIANLVSKNPAGKPKGGLGDDMQASVLKEGFDHGDKATAHDIAGATEVAELYKDWQRLVAEGSPDAARRKETLDRAILAQGLDAVTSAKLKLLEEVGAPRPLLDSLSQVGADSIAMHPVSVIVPGTIPPDAGPKQQLFEEAKALFDRLAKDKYAGEEFAKLQWAAFLREHGIIVPSGVTHVGNKEQAVTASDDVLDRAKPVPKNTAEPGDTVAGETSIGIRSPTLKGTSEAVSRQAFAEVAKAAKGFEVVEIGGDKIKVLVDRDGKKEPVFIKLLQPTHLPDGQMAGMKHDDGEIHVWVSDQLPDDQVNRALGAIMAQATATARAGKQLSADDAKKHATVGQLDALLGHFEQVKVENQKAAKPLPEGGSNDDRIKVASENAKRESPDRIAAEIELLLAKHGADKPGEAQNALLEAAGGKDGKLAKELEQFLAGRQQIGFDASAMADPSKLPAPPKDEKSNRPSTVLPGAPEKVQPYSEADRVKVLELRVALETIAEIDQRLKQRDQPGTVAAPGKDNPIAAGETLRRRDMVERVQKLLADLQLGGTDKAYYDARLAELEKVFPGAATTISPHVNKRVEERRQSDEGHNEAVAYQKRAQEVADVTQATLAASTPDKPFITDRIVVGDGPTGLANIAGLGVTPGADGFVDSKLLLVVGGKDLLQKMAEADPNMRWGQRAGVFDTTDGSEAHPMFRGAGKGDLQKTAEDPGDFATVGQMSDSMDLARKRMGVARAEATVLRVETREDHGGDWAVDSHAVRVVMLVNGKEVVVYANHTDITTGIGKAAMPDESILSKQDRKALTEGDNKVVLSGEDAVTGAPMKDLKVLVMGYGPTGAWASIEAAKRGAKSVDWGGSSGDLSAGSGNESAIKKLSTIDRVQETFDPKSKVNITTDRILKIEPKGEGALVTYVSGTPPNLTTYYVQYDRVIAATKPIPSKTAENVPSKETNAGTMVDGIPMQPQEGTEAPVWESKNKAVRVMGPAAEGVKGGPGDDVEMRKRADAIPRKADEPDPRVMGPTGQAADLANKVK